MLHFILLHYIIMLFYIILCNIIKRLIYLFILSKNFLYLKNAQVVCCVHRYIMYASRRIFSVMSLIIGNVQSFNIIRCPNGDPGGCMTLKETHMIWLVTNPLFLYLTKKCFGVYKFWRWYEIIYILNVLTISQCSGYIF